jgi:hypothetical protein
MFYQEYTSERFFSEITIEEDARELIWRSRFQGNVLNVLIVSLNTFMRIIAALKCGPAKLAGAKYAFEQARCSNRRKHLCLFSVKALFYVMQGKRGMSVLALQRHLGLKSYGLVWTILQKIRMALQQRDKDDQAGDGVVELDAGTFGKRETGNQGDLLVAIESKTWVDQRGKAKSRAGFAKV